MNGRRCAVLAGAVLLAAMASGGAAVLAHHIEVNEFDRSRPVTVTGEVVRVEWINPHPWIHISVAGADGSAHVWEIEAAAPMNLLRRGFSPDSIPPGARVTIDGYQSKDGSLRANGQTLVYADGSRFFIGYLGLQDTAATGDRPQPAEQ